MGPGQDSVESSLCLATAPCADGDFTRWLPAQWTVLSERPFCVLSWEHFIHAGWSSFPFCSKLTLLSPKQPKRIRMRQRGEWRPCTLRLFPGEFSLLSRIPTESHPTAEAMAWMELRGCLLWWSLPRGSCPWDLQLPMQRRPESICCLWIRSICCLRIKSCLFVFSSWDQKAGAFSLWFEARVLATDFPEREPRGWCDKELACFPWPRHGQFCSRPEPGWQKSGPKAAPRPWIKTQAAHSTFLAASMHLSCRPVSKPLERFQLLSRARGHSDIWFLLEHNRSVCSPASFFPSCTRRVTKAAKTWCCWFGDFPFCFSDLMPWPGLCWIFQNHFISCVFPALGQKECTVWKKCLLPSIAETLWKKISGGLLNKSNNYNLLSALQNLWNSTFSKIS